MRSKNFQNIIGKELHKLSIDKKDILFRCSISEIFDFQNRYNFEILKNEILETKWSFT